MQQADLACIPVIVEPCQKLSAVPISVVGIPFSIGINHFWFIVHDQLVQLRLADLLIDAHCHRHSYNQS